MKPFLDALKILVRDPLFLTAIALGAVSIGVVGWFNFADRDPKPDRPKTYTHLHCPSCKEEFPYSNLLAGKRCPNCPGVTYVSTVGTLDDIAKQPGLAGPLVIFTLLSLIAIQGVVFVGIKRLAWFRAKEKDFRNRRLIARCPFCKRKVAFPVGKSGAWTTCRQCKTAFQLNGVEAMEEVV